MLLPLLLRIGVQADTIPQYFIMLKIKLSRTGKINQALYRIVVGEARSKRDGKFTDLLGHYNPNTNPATIVFDTNKYHQWIKKGAQPTKTVKLLFESHQSTK
jgi:small subunit ribosomal protein S16